MSRKTTIKVEMSGTGFTLSPHDVTCWKEKGDIIVWEVIDPVKQATITVPLSYGHVCSVHAKNGDPAIVGFDTDLNLPQGDNLYAVYCESNTLKGYVHSADPKIIVKGP